ncbi:MAG TPA: hypothetical protein VGQ37_25315 [Vicinamibacterales bacterium]|jgi:hypothetical protein|nr:hypothetical protein [Vicinamibacterales bacterium]
MTCAARAWLALLLPAALVAADVVSAQQPERLVFVATADGFTDTYVPAPASALFAFFQGETVRLDIRIGNPTKQRQHIDTTGIPATGAFRLAQEPPNGVPELTFLPLGHVNEVGPPKPVNWGSVIELEPGIEVRWRATFAAEGEPGLYRWRLELPAMRTSVPLELNSDRVDYELRPIRTFADRAELLRRRMVFASLDDEPTTERAATDLLALYPQSHEAHLVLGRLYRDTGRRRAARQHFDTAIRLLSSKRDRLYLDNVRPSIRELDPITALRAERDAIR